MSTAPSMPASAPFDLLPASAHRPLLDIGEVLRRRVARAAVEQASTHPAHPLSRKFGVLPHTSRRFARRAMALRQLVAASTNHHPEAP